MGHLSPFMTVVLPYGFKPLLLVEGIGLEPIPSRLRYLSSIHLSYPSILLIFPQPVFS